VRREGGRERERAALEGEGEGEGEEGRGARERKDQWKLMHMEALLVADIYSS
jgi:hypothetical protein